MVTYQIKQSTPAAWVIERHGCGEAPHITGGDFRSAEQDQAQLNDLMAHERPERVMSE